MASSSRPLSPFSHGHVANIDAGTFSELTKLRKLHIVDRKLRKVKAAWFKHTICLETLELEGNIIDYVKKDAFGNLINVTYLKLARTRLREV